VIASTALQRLRPPLVELRGPSGTRAHLLRAIIGSAQPVRCSTPLGSSANVPAFRSTPLLAWPVKRPSLDFRSPSEFLTGTPRRPADTSARKQWPAGQTTLPLLDFLHPTTQSQTGGSVQRQIPLPPRTTCGVWLPPSRHPPPALPALAHRSVLGLHPSRSSPRPRSVPLSGPIPS